MLGKACTGASRGGTFNAEFTVIVTVSWCNNLVQSYRVISIFLKEQNLKGKGCGPRKGPLGSPKTKDTQFQESHRALAWSHQASQH